MRDVTLDLCLVMVMEVIGSSVNKGLVVTIITMTLELPGYPIEYHMVHFMDGTVLIALYEQDVAFAVVHDYSRE